MQFIVTNMRDIKENDWGAFRHCHAARGEIQCNPPSCVWSRRCTMNDFNKTIDVNVALDDEVGKHERS